MRDLVLRVIKLGLLPYGALIRERRPGVTVLCYHRVGGGSAKQIDLPVSLFEWQMRYVKEHREPVTLDQIAALAQGGQAPGRDAVAITFDDGYEDVYRHAYPILRRYRLPATIYLATAFVEQRRPFSFEGRPEARPGRPLLWRQASEMADSGLITFGAHTDTHPDLTRLGRGEIEAEVAAANRLITARLGRPPQHFAYPWGRTSETARAVVAAAYRTAALGGSRKNPYTAMDLGALLRVPIQRSDGRLLFRLKLQSYLAGEEWLRAYAERRRPATHTAPAGATVRP